MKLESQWIVGFVDGQGCFHIGINVNKTLKQGYQVLPEFVIVQHKRDVKLLYKIKSFFGCGIIKPKNGDTMCYCVRKFDHLLNIIVPFFEKHQLKSLKKVDFLKFRKVIMLIEKKEDLTMEGLEQIRKIRTKKFKIESSPLLEEEGEN